MSERKDEKWLDAQLRRAVDGATPAFDAESWKQKHRREYEALLARGSVEKQVVGWGLPHRFGVSRRLWWGKPHPTVPAVAAAILVAVTLFFASRTDREPASPEVAVGPVAQAPAEMVSLLSLRGAYRQGGVDALDRQLDHALRLLGPRPDRISSWESLEDSEG